MGAAFRVASVNVGEPRTIRTAEGEVETGIFKRPVSGAVLVSRAGLAGDHVADPRYHGGADQAIYLYAAEDYAWWAGRLPGPPEPGTFGENLTLAGCEPAAWRIGDRLRIGSVLLEVTAPRIPCGKLAARMGDPSFESRFRASRRPGAYARVLAGGSVRAGDPGRIEPAGAGHPTVLELADLWSDEERDVELVRRCLAAPLAERARRRLETWLR